MTGLISETQSLEQCSGHSAGTPSENFQCWCFKCISAVGAKVFFSLNRVSQSNLIDKSRILFSEPINVGSWRSKCDYVRFWKKSFLAGGRVHRWNFGSRLRRLIILIIWNGIFKAKLYYSNLDRPCFRVNLLSIAIEMFPHQMNK